MWKIKYGRQIWYAEFMLLFSPWFQRKCSLLQKKVWTCKQIAVEPASQGLHQRPKFTTRQKKKNRRWKVRTNLIHKQPKKNKETIQIICTHKNCGLDFHNKAQKPWLAFAVHISQDKQICKVLMIWLIFLVSHNPVWTQLHYSLIRFSFSLTGRTTVHPAAGFPACTLNARCTSGS